MKLKSIKSAVCLAILTIASSGAQSSPPPRSYSKQAEVNRVDGKIKITADNPRPLIQVLDTLYQQFGWLVGYEDPQYISKMDLVQAGGPDRRGLPAGGKFSVDLAASDLDEKKVLQSVTDAYNASDNPGRFEVRKIDADSFSVVGVESHNSAGKLIRQTPLLNASITILKKKRSVSETLTLICSRVSATKGIRVTMGISPRNVLDGSLVEIGGPKAQARTLVQQALASTHRPLYWRLLFDPGTKSYLFNVHMAPASQH